MSKKNFPSIKQPSSKPVLIIDPRDPLSFLELTDTFNTYTGNEGRFLIVDPSGSGIVPFAGTIESDKHFSSFFGAAASWNVFHSLNKYPTVQVIRQFDGLVIECNIRHTSLNTLVCEFDEPVAGTVICN